MHTQRSPLPVSFFGMVIAIAPSCRAFGSGFGVGALPALFAAANLIIGPPAFKSSQQLIRGKLLPRVPAATAPAV